METGLWPTAELNASFYQEACPACPGWSGCLTSVLSSLRHLMNCASYSMCTGLLSVFPTLQKSGSLSTRSLFLSLCSQPYFYSSCVRTVQGSAELNDFIQQRLLPSPNLAFRAQRIPGNYLWASQLGMKVKVAQLCPTLGDPMDCRVHGIFQSRILEWVAIPFSRGYSQPRDRTQISRIVGRFFISFINLG